MWSLMKGLFEEPKKSSVDVVMDKIKESAILVEPVKLREPVQVLLDSLEEGWWDFAHINFIYKAKHEWLGTEMYFYDSWGYVRDNWILYSEDWMTDEEKKLVSKTARLVKSKMDAKIKLRDDNNREGQFFKLLELKEKE